MVHKVKGRRKRNHKCMRRISSALHELDELALSLRHVSVPGAPGIRPVTAAFYIVLLRWPDRKLPKCLILGFQLTEAIERANIYRPTNAHAVGARVELDAGETLLGPSAKSFVDQLTQATAVPAHAQEIYEATVSEINQGLSGPLRPREYFDELYGVGGWRPLPRHVIWQADRCTGIHAGRHGPSAAHTYCQPHGQACRHAGWQADWHVGRRACRHLPLDRSTPSDRQADRTEASI